MRDPSGANPATDLPYPVGAATRPAGQRTGGPACEHRPFLDITLSPSSLWVAQRPRKRRATSLQTARSAIVSSPSRLTVRDVVRFATAAGFVGIGVTHFVSPEPFVQMMPSALPAPLALVYVSGAAEICGGIGLLIPGVRRAAAWGLLLLLVAVFPANINMAVNEIYLDPMAREPWILWARLPFQFVFAAVVYWVGLATDA